MAGAEEGHTEEQCEGSWHTMTLWLMQASLGSQQAPHPWKVIVHKESCRIVGHLT